MNACECKYRVPMKRVHCVYWCQGNLGRADSQEVRCRFPYSRRSHDARHCAAFGEAVIALAEHFRAIGTPGATYTPLCDYQATVPQSLYSAGIEQGAIIVCCKGLNGQFDYRYKGKKYTNYRGMVKSCPERWRTPAQCIKCGGVREYGDSVCEAAGVCLPELDLE